VSTACAIDLLSLLVDVPGSATLDDVETALAARGLTLGVSAEAQLARGALAIADWLAEGTPGAASVFADPADHVVAGLEATLTDGTRLEVRPGPRRAVGPDLTALVFGAHGRFAKVTRAWLRIHRLAARRQALPLPAGVDLDPRVTPDEARLLDAIEHELRGAHAGPEGPPRDG
jgi:alkyldihydroxyacetonephosphate synthase